MPGLGKPNSGHFSHPSKANTQHVSGCIRKCYTRAWHPSLQETWCEKWLSASKYLISVSGPFLSAAPSRHTTPHGMSRESVYTTPRDVHGYFGLTTLTALGSRCVVESAHSRLPLTDLCRSNSSNNTRDRHRQDDQPPLGIKVTGYDLLNMVVILAFGIRKAISSYRGQSVTWTTLDWVAGTLLVFMYAFIS